jgi:hypothetical protein
MAGETGAIGREIKRSIWGVARFASFDARGMHYLNVTRTGLWRSFLAALVSLPIFLAIAALSYRPTEPIHYINIAVGYGLGWVLFPIILVPVLLALRLDEAYVPLIVAYNWSLVIVYGLDLVTTLLAYADPRLVLSLFLAFQVVSALYRWFVAKVALDSGLLVPFVVIMISEVLDTFLARGLTSVFGPLPLVSVFQPS